MKNKFDFLDDAQLEAVSKMRNGCILNGGVGSGKSRTALYYYFKEHGGSLMDRDYIPMKNPRDLYIITTAKKRDTLDWEAEMLPFHLNKDPDVNQYDNKIVIDSWNNIKKYKDVYGAFFIFDEDRVTGSGVWVKAFLKIARKNRWIILSATPGDSYMDYVPVFVANGFYRNKTDFVDQHVIYSRSTKYPKIDRYLDTHRLDRLRRSLLIDIKSKRHTIQHHEDVYVNYDIHAYREISRSRWNPYTNEPIKTASELCFLWRKVVNSDVSRQIALLELFEDHPRVIIFYNFNYERDILRTIFEGTGVEVAEWNGDKHEPIPTGKTWAYLVQYAANEGWQCITTDTIIFFSQNYSYKTMVQAAGRIDRRNTKYKDLYYYHLKTRSGIDLAISKALKEKKTFNEAKYVKF